jgi:hypothetical protein
MRKLNIVIMLLPVMVLAACSGGNKPEVIAEKFNKAIFTADFEQAKTYCTGESKQAVDFIAAFASQSGDEMKKADIKYEVIDVKMSENGNSADVNGIVFGSIDLKTKKVKDSLDSKIHLIKTNNRWLVDFKLR